MSNKSVVVDIGPLGAGNVLGDHKENIPYNRCGKINFIV